MNKSMLVSLLHMAIESYDESDSPDMIYKYGYDRDGVCCKVFKHENMLVVAIKGSTLNIFGYNMGPSSSKDKKMANVMFKKCLDAECIYRKKINFDKLRYLDTLQVIVNGLRILHPNTSIVFTGHSLGGTLASLLSSIYKFSAVAFASPGEKYISKLLHLDSDKPSVLHYGMCNDYVYTGQCDYLCNLFGYRVNTSGHNGSAYCINTSIPIKSILYHNSTVLLEYIKKLDLL